MEKVTITKRLDMDAHNAGRQEAVFRVLYRLDPAWDGRKQAGLVYQYPPVPVSVGGTGKRLNGSAAEAQLAAEQAAYPDSDFFQVSITL